MNVNINNDSLRRLIPNIIHEVKGETSLADKLQPWIDSAKCWLEDFVLGPDFTPTDISLAEKIIVNRAFSDAVPSLDLTLSPAGFAVIDTDGRSPASKERVTRLIESLNRYVSANTSALIRQCFQCYEWRNTERGRWWSDTLLQDLAVAYRIENSSDPIATFLHMRDIAIQFEHKLADKYLGRELLRALKTDYDNQYSEYRELVLSKEIKYIIAYISGKTNDNPDTWEFGRRLLAELSSWPALRQIWQNDLGSEYVRPGFENNVKGAFYF